MARGSRGVPLYTSDGSSDPVTETAASTAAPQRRRDGGSWRNMIYSLAILLVPIVVALGVWQFLSSGHEVSTVDTRPAISQARQADRFPVSVPTGLSDGWRPTSAATTRTGDTVTLRIGYVTPSGGFAQLVESNRDSAKLLADSVSPGSRPSGSVRIDGRDWSRYTGEKNRDVLALLEQRRTVVVIGQTTDTELHDLAASLR
ncbi:MAG: DUF4245 domain-containing protein [Actinocatenispora sp.]